MSTTVRDVACNECGSVNPQATALLDQIKQALSLAERDLRAKRAQIQKMRGEQDEALTARPEYTDAMTALVKWRDVLMPSARELASQDRLGHAIARLRGTGKSKYKLEDLLACVEGYRRFPYVTRRGRQSSGTPAEWRADAELIFRSPVHVDNGIRMSMEQVHYSPQSLEFVPWREARRANRKAIVDWLTAREMPSQVHNRPELLSWHCPNCQPGVMFVNSVDSEGVLSRCNHCEMEDAALLGLIQTEKKR